MTADRKLLRLPHDITSLILECLVEETTPAVSSGRIRFVENKGVAHFNIFNSDIAPGHRKGGGLWEADVTRVGLLWSPDARHHPVRIWRAVCTEFAAQAKRYIWRHVWLLHEHHDMLRTLQHLHETYGPRLRDMLSRYTVSIMYCHWVIGYDERKAVGDQNGKNYDPFTHEARSKIPKWRYPGHAPHPGWCIEALKGRGMTRMLRWFQEEVLLSPGWRCIRVKKRRHTDARLNEREVSLRLRKLLPHDNEASGHKAEDSAPDIHMKRWFYICSPLVGGRDFDSLIFELVFALNPEVNLALDFSRLNYWYARGSLTTWVQGCEAKVTILCPSEVRGEVERTSVGQDCKVPDDSASESSDGETL